MYADGLSSPPKQVVDAYKWLRLSAEQGNESAQAELERIKKEMTRDRISEAEKLVGEFKPVQASRSRARGLRKQRLAELRGDSLPRITLPPP
jgi:TPR repeat protein